MFVTFSIANSAFFKMKYLKQGLDILLIFN